MLFTSVISWLTAAAGDICLWSNNAIVLQHSFKNNSQHFTGQVSKVNLYTKILEVNLFAFAYRLFHRDFSPINGTHLYVFTELRFCKDFSPPLRTKRSYSPASVLFI